MPLTYLSTKLIHLIKLQLVQAAKSNNTSQVIALLDAGIDVNTKLPDANETVLHYAIKNGNAQLVELLLRRGAHSVNSSIDGRTLLKMATANPPDVGLIGRLIEAGLDVNAYDVHGWTPLHYLCRRGSGSKVRMLRCLVNAGCNVHASTRDSAHWSNLHLAALNNEKYCEVLIEEGCCVDPRDSQDRTPLHIAAANNRRATCELLFKNGANLSAQDQFGRTPLHLAAESGHVSIVEFLLVMCNIDCSQVDSNNQTPLQLAIENAHPKVVEMMLQSSLEAQKEVNVSTKKGSLLYMAVKSNSLATVKCLLDYGANMDFQDFGGVLSAVRLANLSRPLIFDYLKLVESMLTAAKANDSDKVKSSLLKGASINAQNNDGHSVLHLAVCNGSLNLVSLLLNNEARLNVRTVAGYTPLHLSILYRKHEITSKLIEHANSKLEPVELLRLMDAQCVDNKDTALHLAAKMNQLELIKLLIRSGAAYDQQNADNNYASDLTDHKSYLSMVEQFIQLIKSNDTDKALQMLALEPSLANVRSISDGLTPLHRAVISQNVDLVDGLLESNATMHLPSKSGHTPLHEACLLNDFVLVNRLIDRCPIASRSKFVNTRCSKSRKTPLHFTSDPRIVQKLLENWAVFDLVDAEGNTPGAISNSNAQALSNFVSSKNLREK